MEAGRHRHGHRTAGGRYLLARRRKLAIRHRHPTATATVPASAAAAAGPLLSSMPYASFAYLVWPGPVSADGKLAMSRWKLTVTRQAGGITVQAAEDGQSMASVSRFYPGGAKVYILDSDLGADAAGNTNEGLEVTNTQGQVLP